jgi:hypothetical protein
MNLVYSGSREDRGHLNAISFNVTVLPTRCLAKQEAREKELRYNTEF